MSIEDKLRARVKRLELGFEKITRHGPGCDCGPRRAYDIARAALADIRKNDPSATSSRPATRDDTLDALATINALVAVSRETPGARVRRWWRSMRRLGPRKDP